MDEMSPSVKRLKSIKEFSVKWNHIVAVSVGVVLIILTILIIIDVTGRYVFNSPLKAGTEITTSFLAYIVFLTYSLALSDNSHIRVGLIYDRFHGLSRVIADIITNLIGLIMFFVMTWGMTKLFATSVSINELMPATVVYPYWIPKGVAMIGCWMMAIQYIIELYYSFASIATGYYRVEEAQENAEK